MPSSLQHEIFKRKPFDSPQQEAFLNLLRTSSVLMNQFEQLFKRHDLSLATYNVLRILRGAGEAGRKCHEIGEHMVTAVPDVTRLVDRLEKAGLASRHRCTEDRRIVHVRITEQGRGLLKLLDEPVLDLHKAQMGHMSTIDLDQLNALLVQARTATPSDA